MPEKTRGADMPRSLDRSRFAADRQQAERVGDGKRAGPVAHTELAEQAGLYVLYGFRGYAQLPGGLPDRVPAAQRTQDVALPRGQLGKPAPPRLVPPDPGGLDQRAHRHRVDDQVSLADHAQYGQEMGVDPVRRDQRTRAGRQRAGELRGIERLAVYQDRRDAQVGDQFPVSLLWIDEHGHHRA